MGIFKKKKKKQPATSEIELQNQAPIATSEEVFIKSNEELNKTDGVVIIATIDNENIVPNNAQMPAQIDIEDRRQKVLLSRKEKIKKQTKNSRARKKANTITSIIVLMVMAALGGFFYYYRNLEQEKDFELKVINLELGTEVPQNVSYYVKRENIDEMEYSIDLSGIDINKVGIYKYSVTHVGVTKEGTIFVKDTTPPEATAKDKVVQLGTQLIPQDFIESCTDLTGCNLEFENSLIKDSTKQIGEYEVYIVITDEHNNLSRKKANLKVVEVLETLFCTLETDLTEDYYYIYYDTLELTYADRQYLTHNYFNEFHFTNEDKYLEYKNEYAKRDNYLFNDNDQILTVTQQFTMDHEKTIETYKAEYEQRGYICSIQ